METLYQRLGGAQRITAIIEESLDRHAVNPTIAHHFKGKDLPRLKQLGAQFFCAGAGGPEKYEGRDLRSVHAGLNINEAEFAATMDDILAALASNGVPQAEVDEVVGILNSLKAEVMRTG